MMFLFCTSVSTTALNSISVPFEHFDSKEVLINLSFKNENFTYPFIVNTAISSSLLYIEKEHIIPSSIQTTLEMNYNNKKYSSYLYNTEINLKNNTIKDYSMYITNQLIISIQEKGIAFGYHYEKASFSLVHNLYKNGIISKLQFTFHNSKRGLEGHLIIGDNPNDEHLSLPYQGIIKINKRLPTWGFNLEKIIYNNNVYTINLPCIINSVSNDMFTSDILYKIMLSIFKEKDDCKETKRRIQCRNINKNEEKLTFIFDNINIEFKLKDLFDINHLSTIVMNNNDSLSSFDGIILGIDFLNKFNFVLFDYSNNQIGFYSNSIPITEKKNTMMSNNILYINSIICIMSIIGLLIN